jgi:autotransporter-associated beta strand protein
MNSIGILKTSVLLANFIAAGHLAMCPLQAQQLFPDLLTPSFRGGSGAEYSEWDDFTEPFALPNLPDIAAPANPPELTQTLTETAFITSGFNIYSFSAATGYEIVDSTPAPATNVVFQFDTLGTFMDSNSILLSYDLGSGPISLSPTNFITESRIITGGFGGFTNRSAMQWDLTGLGISSYTIRFHSLGSSNSFNRGVLDTSSASYAEVVPSARTWDGGGGTSLWSTGANWASTQPAHDNTVHAPGGNVTFDASAPASITLDGNREVGQLNLKKAGSLTISGSSTLTVNSGIASDAPGSGTHIIAAPVRLGGHGFVDVGDGEKLTLSAQVSGAGPVGSYPATGLYKSGAGELEVTGNMTFGGGVTVDGGVMTVSGTNTYTGTTGVFSGKLIAKGNALLSTPGALGHASSTINVGSTGSFGEPDAGLIIDGDHTIARAISLTSGTDGKILGAQNTSSGAAFTGNVALQSTASNIKLEATHTNDTVAFSGQMSGGGTSHTLTKIGSGTVLYTGANKTYANATIVQQGTLSLASATSMTGNGAITVQNGATLHVDGTVGGTGGFTLQDGGALTGDGVINRTVITGGIGSALAAGNSAGSLQMTGLNASLGATFDYELGSVSDLIQITGTFTGSSNPGGLRFSFENLGDALAGNSYTLLTFGSASGLAYSDLALFESEGWVLDSSFGSGGWLISANSLQVQFSAIPEPSGATLTTLALLLGLAWRRCGTAARAQLSPARKKSARRAHWV